MDLISKVTWLKEKLLIYNILSLYSLDYSKKSSSFSSIMKGKFFIAYNWFNTYIENIKFLIQSINVIIFELIRILL